MTMRLFPTSRLWLLLCPALMAMLDCGITLHGQPAEYWRGNYSVVREGNEYGRALLMFGPWLFALLEIINHSAYFWAILRIPSAFAVIVSFIVMFVHMIGAGTWIISLGIPGWLIVVPLIFFTQRLFSFCLKKADVKDFNLNDLKSSSLNSILRDDHQRNTERESQPHPQ